MTNKPEPIDIKDSILAIHAAAEIIVRRSKAMHKAADDIIKQAVFIEQRMVQLKSQMNHVLSNDCGTHTT